MDLLKKIRQLISFEKEEDQSSEVLQYNENPSNLDVIPDGEYVYYDDEDESLLVKNYRDGKLNGPSYFHYVSGELWIETNFKDGLEHGTLTYYEKDGSVIKTETWENGKCISTNTPEKTTKSGREEEKKSFRDDDYDKFMLFDEYVDGVECFGYFFHSKKHDDFSFGVYEIYLSDEFRTEISLKLKPSEFLEKDINLEQFKSYLHENIEKGQYDLSEPRKIWEKYTCRYQSKVDENGKYVPKYSEEELIKIEHEEYLTPIEWTRRFCNWKELKQRKFKVQTYDD
ncbi:hypothetical protein M9C84_06925 [SAR86 cluster bacterium]|nr:hypothetical protein M9C84_06925 [SAR86 cluster bacterium]